MSRKAHTTSAEETARIQQQVLKEERERAAVYARFETARAALLAVGADPSLVTVPSVPGASWITMSLKDMETLSGVLQRAPGADGPAAVARHQMISRLLHEAAHCDPEHRPGLLHAVGLLTAPQPGTGQGPG